MAGDRQHRQALPTGHLLQEYRIERVLGSGGFGITYLAVDRHLGTQVAIKEYLPTEFAFRTADHAVVARTEADEADFEWGRERFLEEARLLARFDHPNIVRVRRYLEAHGTGCIVMEHVAGEPLSAILARNGRLTQTEVENWVLPLLDGLAEVHSANLLHRDIKPGNIMVGADGIPVLIDFGSARQAVGAKSRSLTAVMTLGYAPFEQYSAKGRQDARTDIYAFAAVLYRCVTGQVPHEAAERILNDGMKPASELASGEYSEGLLVAIDRALSVRMEGRPEDIDAFRRELGGAVAPPSHRVKRTFTSAQDDLREPSVLCPLQVYESWGMEEYDYWGEEDQERWEVYVGEVQEDVPDDWEEGNHEPWKVLGSDLQQDAHGSEGEGDLRHWAEYVAEVQRQVYESLGEEDAAEVVHWYRQIASRGYARGQFSLGVCYEKGKGVERNEAKAAYWYRQAAEQGYAAAQYNLGYLYYRGEGVEKDATEAVRWYRQAAEQGCADSQYHLGLCYYTGEGIEEDPVEAVRWCRLAADQWHTEAQFELSLIYKTGKKVFNEETGEIEVEKDRAEAAHWLRLAADQGHADAQFELGLSYEEGVWNELEEKIEEPVPAEAARWYRLAADQGHARAQNILGVRCERANPAEAERWYRLAADQGNAHAQANLRNLLEKVRWNMEYEDDDIPF